MSELKEKIIEEICEFDTNQLCMNDSKVIYIPEFFFLQSEKSARRGIKIFYEDKRRFHSYIEAKEVAYKYYLNKKIKLVVHRSKGIWDIPELKRLSTQKLINLLSCLKNGK